MSAQVAKKINILTAHYKRILKAQVVFPLSLRIPCNRVWLLVVLWWQSTSLNKSFFVFLAHIFPLFFLKSSLKKRFMDWQKGLDKPFIRQFFYPYVSWISFWSQKWKWKKRERDTVNPRYSRTFYARFRSIASLENKPKLIIRGLSLSYSR